MCQHTLVIMHHDSDSLSISGTNAKHCYMAEQQSYLQDDPIYDASETTARTEQWSAPTAILLTEVPMWCAWPVQVLVSS